MKLKTHKNPIKMQNIMMLDKYSSITIFVRK